MHKSRGACLGLWMRADTIDHACLCRKRLTTRRQGQSEMPRIRRTPLNGREVSVKCGPPQVLVCATQWYRRRLCRKRQSRSIAVDRLDPMRPCGRHRIKLPINSATPMPESFRYCLSYTAVLLTFLPFASVPLKVTVRLLPSAETTTLPLIVVFPPFLLVNFRV